MMQVLTAGAGIGGLTTALQIQQLGLDVKIFESVRQIKPLARDYYGLLQRGRV
jgi:2-polyprenyl-6-methoxyphenol hydroxylase-like FAD-dependent oxidoreductase